MAWRLQEAKQRFSELVRRTLDEGPQVITRHGEEVVVVVAADVYRSSQAKESNFVEFLLSGPRFRRPRPGQRAAARGSARHRCRRLS